MAEEKNEEIKKARKEVEYLTGDEETRRLAELREKWEMDYNSSIGHAREEEKIEIAKKMLKEKMSVEQISKITGLAKENIVALLEN